MMNKGYSLIEIMVVMTLFALLMLIASQTLLLSLRGSAKSESVGKVKENLEFAISIIERQIRSAKDVNPCTDMTPNVLTYTTANGTTGSFSCQNIGPEGYIASGSANIRITNTNVSITECSLTCAEQAGIPPEVQIKITAEDKSTLPGAEKARATNETRVLLRQY